MPFLKSRNKIEPPWKKWEKITFKTGLRHAVFAVIGDKYIGEWKDNKKHGKGALYTHSGKLYEGDWERGYRHGYGILTIEQEDGNYATEYFGQWENGRKKGFGVGHYANGSYYEGNWYRGKRHGYGRQWFEDGSYYEGRWARDKFHGEGMMVYTNGNRYEGEWYQGVKHGKGRFFHLLSGQLQYGVWNEDVAVVTTFVDIYYRQSSVFPTPYPLPKIELQDPVGVYKDSKNEVLNKMSRASNEDVRSRVLLKELACSEASINRIKGKA
ncbi:MORN repeat-containing protein 3-like [Anabrus simplex]|uniref:MORN repeat-containing protein 3-like n=1 Tax=Anabrus simplex TaxID=316456 RepID=UPI0035A397DE